MRGNSYHLLPVSKFLNRRVRVLHFFFSLFRTGTRRYALKYEGHFSSTFTMYSNFMRGQSSPRPSVEVHESKRTIMSVNRFRDVDGRRFFHFIKRSITVNKYSVSDQILTEDERFEVIFFSMRVFYKDVRKFVNYYMNF